MKEFFQERAGRFLRLESDFRKKGKLISNFRWLCFILFFIFFVYLFSSALYLWSCLLFVVFLIVYIPLVIRHTKVNAEADYNKVLAEINREEVSRLQGKLEALEQGNQYYDTKHPYAKDLDIFGNYSLFQYINRCSTENGMDKLASWLKYPSEKAEIEQRQKAVAELRDLVDFRQNLQAEGKLVFITRKHLSFFNKWLSPQQSLLHKKWFQLLIVTLNILTLFTLLACLFTGNWKLFFIPVIFNSLFLAYSRIAVKDLKETTESLTQSLRSKSKILALLENQEVVSERLTALRKSLESNGVKSSVIIKELAHLFEMLDYTSNPYFYLVANYTILWDLHWASKIEKLKLDLYGQPEKWLEALYEYEAIAGLAGLAYLNRNWIFPQITEEKFLYHGENIAHPLIFSDNAVANDFSLKGISNTVIITGSNMSGKSTFLRTLGINAVLAFAGAPVCAGKLSLSVFRVFSSMRTEDNLQESTSSFYAELKRLKQLLEYLDDKQPVFYLLDEILKGTNSADRNTGGKALVRQLQGKNASGLIATHDIELSNLEKEAEGRIFNFNFSSEVVNGGLNFDYKLKPGVCKSFNATELMKQIGIDVDLGR